MRKAMALKEMYVDSTDKREKYTLTVVGCGRMGLPTACLFAEVGFKVICLDTNRYIISQIKKGQSPFLEPGLTTLIKKSLKRKNFEATSDTKEAIFNSDIIVIVVNTPINEKKKPDYSRLKEACRNIGLNLKKGSLLIFMSTVGPGQTENTLKEMIERASGMKTGVDFGLAHSPIRATVGRVIQDITNYNRIVSAIDKQSLKAAKAVLGTIIKGNLFQVDNIRTAEAVKLFENIYRDVNLALSNELAKYCEKSGIDYIEVQKAATTQPYCHLLKPGLVSGHIPKDPYLLIDEASNLGVKLKMSNLARKVNDDIIKHAFNLIKDALQASGKTINRSKVAIIGISYRPNVKETKGTLVKNLVKFIQKKGIRVSVFDPFFSEKELRDLGYPSKINFTKTVEGADCLVIAVGHERLKRLRLRSIQMLMKKPAALVDLSNVVSPKKAEEFFVYRGLGRGVWTK
jgi:UDP-N-acetyl-D-mannosaminuronic acid dehydrogenase